MIDATRLDGAPENRERAAAGEPTGAADRPPLELGDERYRSLFVHLPFPLYAWRWQGEDFTLVDFNDAAIAFTSGGVARALGVRASEWFDDQARILDALRRCLRTRQPVLDRVEYRFRTIPRTVCLDVAYCFVPPDTVLVHTVDVTEQVRAADAKRESESRYRAVIEVLHDGVVLCDVAGVVRDCNPGLLHLLGRERSAVIGLAGDDPSWEWVYEDGSPCTFESGPLQVALRCGEPRTKVIRGLTRGDGHRVWVSISSEALRDERTGEPQGIVCSFADVTQLKEAQDSLRDLSAQLLRSRDEEGRRIARELHDSTAQGLTAAAMSLEVAARALVDPSPAAAQALEQCRTLLEACGREVRTLSYLLHPPLLEESGLRSALALFGEGLAARSGLDVTVEVPADLARLPRAVELAAFRIVQESLGNAIRHGQARSVVVRLARRRDGLTLEIVDDGVGSRGTRRRTAAADALGVGVAGMRERARLLGGRLTLELGPDGATVRAWLPVVEGET